MPAKKRGRSPNAQPGKKDGKKGGPSIPALREKLVGDVTDGVRAGSATAACLKSAVDTLTMLEAMLYGHRHEAYNARRNIIFSTQDVEGPAHFETYMDKLVNQLFDHESFLVNVEKAITEAKALADSPPFAVQAPIPQVPSVYKKGKGYDKSKGDKGKGYKSK